MTAPKDLTKVDEWRRRLSEAHLGMRASDDTRRKMSQNRQGERNPHFGKKHSPETLKKISDALKGKYPSEETKRKLSEIRKEQWADNVERRRLAAERARNRIRTQEEREKLSEAQILLLNEIWYGGVKYKEKQMNKYCELWNKNLRDRIRAYWDHKSSLSGKAREENNNRLLSCHHVYYQKKACCEWDEDTEGYFCWIDGEKYYIKGDPNKFVLLTGEENTMVNFNKLKWIKVFEDIIESQGGKCYLTKEEFIALFGRTGIPQAREESPQSLSSAS